MTQKTLISFINLNYKIEVKKAKSQMVNPTFNLYLDS